MWKWRFHHVSPNIGEESFQLHDFKTDLGASDLLPSCLLSIDSNEATTGCPCTVVWKPWADYSSDMLGLILSFSRRVKSLGIIWVSIVWKGSLGTPHDEWWRCPKLLTSSRLYFLIPMHWFGTTSDHQSLMEWQPEDPINSSHWKLGRWQSLYIAYLYCVQIFERSLQAVWIPR